MRMTTELSNTFVTSCLMTGSSPDLLSRFIVAVGANSSCGICNQVSPSLTGANICWFVPGAVCFLSTHEHISINAVLATLWSNSCCCLCE